MDISNSISVSSPPAAFIASAQFRLNSSISSTELAAKTGSSNVAPTAAASSQVTDALKAINLKLEQTNPSHDLDFSLDQDTGITIVRVVDASTKEIITQFPAEVVVRIAHELSQYKGALVSETA